MTKELLQQAVDALDAITDKIDGTGFSSSNEFSHCLDTIDALRSALAAPQPEPIGNVDQVLDEVVIESLHLDRKTLVYLAPPAAPEECDMADDGGCPVCGEDGGTSCGMPNCGLLQGAAPATSADYAMGYAEGFNDACKPAPAVPDWMHRMDEILSNAIVSRTDAEIVDAARLVFIEGWESKSAAPVVPLTDEQIRTIWDGHIVPVFDKNGINPIVFARAIEAHHGIGGGGNG